MESKELLSTRTLDADHTVEVKKEHVCQFCQQRFPSRNQLFIHLKRAHVPEHTPTSDIAAPSELVNQSLRVVYEDAECKVLWKPHGLSTMGEKGANVYNDPIMLIPERQKPNLGYRKAVPCHRLDRLTAGLLVCSKSRTSERSLRDAFRYRCVKKRYMAICRGQLIPSVGVIDEEISGKRAVTLYAVSQCTVSRSHGHLSTVHLWPITGRQHQLRRHLANKGHPIIGDTRYSSALSWSEVFPVLFLVAVEVALPRECTWGQLVTERIKPYCKEVTDVGERLDWDVDERERGAEGKEEEEELETFLTSLQSASAFVSSSTPGQAHQDLHQLLQSMSRGLHPPAAFSTEDILHISVEEPEYFERFRRFERDIEVPVAMEQVMT